MRGERWGGLGHQRPIQGLGNSYFLSPSLIPSSFSFSHSPSLAVKAQYLRPCNYWYVKNERSQLAEEEEVTKGGGTTIKPSKAPRGVGGGK